MRMHAGSAFISAADPALACQALGRCAPHQRLTGMQARRRGWHVATSSIVALSLSKMLVAFVNAPDGGSRRAEAPEQRAIQHARSMVRPPSTRRPGSKRVTSAPGCLRRVHVVCTCSCTQGRGCSGASSARAAAVMIMSARALADAVTHIHHRYFTPQHQGTEFQLTGWRMPSDRQPEGWHSKPRHGDGSIAFGCGMLCAGGASRQLSPLSHTCRLPHLK